MTKRAQQIGQMIDMLPEQEQEFAFELMKKIVLAWDPDFTKLTVAEKNALEISIDQINAGETISHDDIDWN